MHIHQDQKIAVKRALESAVLKIQHGDKSVLVEQHPWRRITRVRHGQMSANFQLGPFLLSSRYRFHWTHFSCSDSHPIELKFPLVRGSGEVSAASRSPASLPGPRKAMRFPLPLPLISAGASPTEPRDHFPPR